MADELATGAARLRHHQRLIQLLRRGPLLRSLAGAVILQSALLVSGPLSARMLGPQNRGYLAVLTTFSSTLGQIGGFGISIAATYYLASNRLGGREVIRLLRRPALVQTLTLVTLYAAVAFGYMLFEHAPIFFPVCVSLVSLPALLMLDYGIAFALGGRRHGLAITLRAIGPIFFALWLVVLYVRGAGSLIAVVIALVAGSVVAGSVGLLLGTRAALRVHATEALVERVGPKVARSEMLAFGRKGYVGLLSPTDTFRIDQIVIALLLSPRVVGIYAVGAAFSNFSRLLGVSIGMSATTEVARHSDIAEQRAVVRHTLRQTAVALAIVSVLVGLLLVELIPIMFGHVYSSSVPVAECLLVATGVLALKRVSVDLMRGAGEPRLGTPAEIINVTLFLLLCAPAALTAGSVGVAACLAGSTVVGYLYLLRQMRNRGFLGPAQVASH